MAARDTQSEPALPSYSRSFEGAGGRSPHQTVRGTPCPPGSPLSGASRQGPTLSSRLQTPTTFPAAFVQEARGLLVKQRAFRIDQLNVMARTTDDRLVAAQDEVTGRLREAAQLVLSQINAALERIEQGTFGRCQSCGDLMSMDRLAALPMSTRCGSCQRLEAMDGAELPWGGEELLARADPSPRLRVGAQTKGTGPR
jgi:DnaK suppressor protein